MQIEQIKPGKYVVAVSGGVDSVVLLDILSKLPNLKLVVAHFDHGIRTASAEDRKFVEQLAIKYGLPFEYTKGLLGKEASEEEARNARYAFLRRIKEKYNAQAIVTAHHQDDIVETIILNVLRGTGRRGLSSLQSTPEIIRPLLGVNKNDIKKYAQSHQLKWREDETNQDTAYMRNWIRIKIVPKLSTEQRKKLITMYEFSKDRNQAIDQAIDDILTRTKDTLQLNSTLFAQLSHTIAKELLAAWLRKNGLADFDRYTIERLTVGMKTLAKNKMLDVKKGYAIVRKGDSFRLTANKR